MRELGFYACVRKVVMTVITVGYFVFFVDDKMKTDSKGLREYCALASCVRLVLCLGAQLLVGNIWLTTRKLIANFITLIVKT